MRDMLSAGIAIYDEYPEMYELSAARFFREHLPVRNWLYNGHAYHQGDSYGPYRFSWDCFPLYIFDRLGSAQTLAISAPISGGTPTDPFIKIGDGTLSLTGTNTFESLLVITNGFLSVNNGTALGNPTNTITLHRPTSTSSSFNKIGPLYFTDIVATNERPIIVGSAVSYIGLYKGTFLCGAPHVLPTNSYVSFGVGYAMKGFLDLNGFDQQVKFLRYSTASGSTNIFVNSAHPATLTLQGDSDVRPFVGYFSGAASLRHRNSGTLAFISPGCASTTTGDLLIEAGTVAFRTGASWTGSTNITVTGGTLSVEGGDGNTFGGSDPEINITTLHLTSSSIVNLEAGITEYVNKATLDGVHLPIGTYGSADSNAQFKSVLFTGTGILHVMRTYDEGTLIMLL
jgi:hypothetical protein